MFDYEALTLNKIVTRNSHLSVTCKQSGGSEAAVRRCFPE